MLKEFSVKNYKNFKEEVCINFCDTAGYQFNDECITDGMISKMLIYGRNATGKTNLGRAIGDIFYIVRGGIRHIDEGTFLNADSREDSATFAYDFQFGEHELRYRYKRLASWGLKEEELLIGQEIIYQCDFFNNEYRFDNLQYVGAEDTSVERYLENFIYDEDNTEEGAELQLPFLRWLINNVALKNDSLLLKLSEFVRGMAMMTVSLSQGVIRKTSRINNVFFESLEDLNALEDFEEFLNVMGVKCKLVLKRLPDEQKELYFMHDKLVPFFENASSGTLALVELYRRIIVAGRNASFLYLDEFDAFYHYEMAENIVRFLKSKYSKCQIVMTTHNTNLMTNKLMRPDCLFILSTEGKMTALCNATQRELREGHNLEKMYISGEFEKYE